ncbi:ATP-binding protein [Helicobacter cholecystus]|uniref:ATP-binding protein n=1 Tax=Helicobacter cholecystus TaxID=45498 RepID=A0A3D8IZ15_9HELI|nr:ATP-binding protein [Helicobacter cholecystus]RDU69874.1 ATP-binding protein [Helicobacter cholecystus]VEJ25748.1 ATPase [Helicobacter cholecystus]
MHIFSQFFNEKTYNILPRELCISSNKIVIYGPPKSGKTSLALDYINSLEISSKKIAYLDCQDPRVRIEEAKSELLKLYLEKKIEALILESYPPSFALPNLPIILLTSNSPISLPTFSLLKTRNLSFAEYISFDRKNSSTQTLLKNFIKDGNLPQIHFLNDYQKIKTKQDNLKIALEENYPLFCKLSSFSASKLTAHQFYSLLKKEQKISKDRLYKFWERLESEGILINIPHIQESKNKKIYFYDFTLPKALNSQSTILQILENMFILELLIFLEKRGDTLAYDDQNFFITQKNGVFLFAPFAHQDFIIQKLKKSPYSQVKIITLEKDWEMDGVYDFMEFSLGEIE